MFKRFGWMIFLCACQPNQEMASQPSFRTYERPEISGLRLQQDPHSVVYQTSELAQPVTKKFLDFGQRVYRIHCSHCHGPRGRGSGLIPQHGFSVKPLGFFTQTALRYSPQDIYEILTYGKGRMLPVAHRLGEEERWAASHFVKVLQVAHGLEETP